MYLRKSKLLVYLTAFLVLSGETLFGVLSKKEGRVSIVRNPDGTTSIPPNAIIPNFYNTTELEWAERAPSLLCPEPANVATTPLNLTDDRFGRVSRAYIECTQDKAVSLEQQRSMQSRLPCKYIITMDTDHSPFFSAPSELAANLIDLASKE